MSVCTFFSVLRCVYLKTLTVSVLLRASGARHPSVWSLRLLTWALCPLPAAWGAPQSVLSLSLVSVAGRPPCVNF